MRNLVPQVPRNYSGYRDGADRIPETQDSFAQLCRVEGGLDGSEVQETLCDRVVFLTEGSMSVGVGESRYELSKYDLLFLPKGCSFSETAEASANTIFLEVFVRNESRASGAPRHVRFDHDKFGGDRFARQLILDRESGSERIAVNLVKVAEASGSPDHHIHLFDQCYFILSGSMVVELGRSKQVAKAGDLVFIPAGTVHRNYNVGPGPEMHVTLIVPEPMAGDVLDYAVDIHNREAELLTELPA